MTKHLLDCTGNHCRWPMWRDNCTLIVCGEPGYPWCEKHHDIVFQRKNERDRQRAAFANALVDDAAATLRREAAKIVRGVL